VDLNATQAAIRAGYSEKTASVIGAENLVKPNVEKRIAELREKLSKRTEITTDGIMQELDIVGKSNIKDYVEKKGGKGAFVFKDIDDIPDEKARAIESISINYQTGEVKFRLHSKVKALELEGRHLGMFKDKDPFPTDFNFRITYANGNGRKPSK